MTPAELQALVGKPVRIVKPLWEDGYVEAGMFAHLMAYDWNDDPDTVKITLNLAPFREYNKARESSNWYKRDEVTGAKSLTTATAAGYYPEGDADHYYLMKSDVLADLMVEGLPADQNVDEQIKTLLAYGRKQGLTQGVERIVTSLQEAGHLEYGN